MTGVFNINRRRFIFTSGIGFAAVVALIATLILSGSVFAALPIAGVGGVQMNATSITGSGFELITNFSNADLGNMSVDELDGDPYGIAGSSREERTLDQHKVYPMAEIFIKEDLEIEDLNLVKNLNVVPYHAIGLPSNVNYVSVCIQAGTTDGEPVTGSGVIMNASRIEADELTIGTMVLQEDMSVSADNIDKADAAGVRMYHPVTGEYIDTVAPQNATIDMNDMVPIGMTGETLAMDGARINAHFMKLDSITLPDMVLMVKLYDSSNTQIDPAALNIAPPASGTTQIPADQVWETHSAMEINN